MIYVAALVLRYSAWVSCVELLYIPTSTAYLLSHRLQVSRSCSDSIFRFLCLASSSCQIFLFLMKMGSYLWGNPSLELSLSEFKFYKIPCTSARWSLFFNIVCQFALIGHVSACWLPSLWDNSSSGLASSVYTHFPTTLNIGNCAVYW